VRPVNRSAQPTAVLPVRTTNSRSLAVALLVATTVACGCGSSSHHGGARPAARADRPVTNTRLQDAGRARDTSEDAASASRIHIRNALRAGRRAIASVLAPRHFAGAPRIRSNRRIANELQAALRASVKVPEGRLFQARLRAASVRFQSLKRHLRHKHATQRERSAALETLSALTQQGAALRSQASTK
jgi:hypothetical protein